MPSPFLRTQRNTSSNAMTERPEPITPVLERVQGENHPYRGLEEHGVDDVYDPADPLTNTVDIDGRPVPIEYVPEEKMPDPIPVKIVQDSSREYRMFWTDRVTLSDGRSSILGRDDKRVTARITNTDATKTVWVASNPADLSLRGYPLGPGKDLTVSGEMPVYATATDGTGVILGLYVETVVPERHA